MRSSFLAFVGLCFIGSVFGCKPKKSDPVETAFKYLKKQLCGSKKAPFYVICVMRSGNDPLSSVDREFLKVVLEKVLNKSSATDIKQRIALAISNIFSVDYAPFIESFTLGKNLPPSEIDTLFKSDVRYGYLYPDYSMVRQLSSDDKLRNKDEQKICKMIEIYEEVYNNAISFNKKILEKYSGIVVFQEYFFCGGDTNRRVVVPEQIAEAETSSFSQIDRNLIWMCNYLSTHKEICQQVQDFTRYQEPDVNGTVRCRTDLPQLPTNNDVLCNQSLFGHEGVVFASYKKRTYRNESDQFLQKTSSWYDFGDGRISLLHDQKRSLFTKMDNVIQPYICADYEYVSFDQLKPKKILILQSNSIFTPYDYYEHLLATTNKLDGKVYKYYYPDDLINENDFDSELLGRKIFSTLLSKIPRQNYDFLVHSDPKRMWSKTTQKRSGVLLQPGSTKKAEYTKTLAHSKGQEMSIKARLCRDYENKCNPHYMSIKAKKPAETTEFKINDITYRIELYEVK